MDIFIRIGEKHDALSPDMIASALMGVASLTTISAYAVSTSSGDWSGKTSSNE